MGIRRTAHGEALLGIGRLLSLAATLFFLLQFVPISFLLTLFSNFFTSFLSAKWGGGGGNNSCKAHMYNISYHYKVSYHYKLSGLQTSSFTLADTYCM